METITTEQLDLKALNQMILDFIYPVGAIAIFWNNFNPNSKLGGTWVKISSGKFLEQSDSDSNLGASVTAGLSNIKVQFGISKAGHSSNSRQAVGAFSFTDWGSGNSALKSGSGTSFSFDASRGTYNISRTQITQENSPYGKSNTVQPSSYKVNMWRRTA